ncbi:hypothetical protein [Acetobacter pasteurianus]|uniref:Uncharacterized protein n=1 Tax=Acetobacter pasteurianus NBRC 3188 TaxID=1226663 RepID=A0A401WY83_ACEPA|nr:hypothetical protein [Acetobacter pasteurianus]GCD54264.1 hypothetical protein NBRC3188_2961 [Acetobacter pasteurianus NBRC 3188]
MSLKKRSAWVLTRIEDKTTPGIFSMLDGDVPPIPKNVDCALRRYTTSFTNIAEVPDNDCFPLKDSLVIWLESLTQEGRIPPHKYLDWEMNRIPSEAQKLLLEYGIDALKFRRLDDSRTRLVIVDKTKVSQAKANIYRAAPENILKNSLCSDLKTSPNLQIASGDGSIHNLSLAGQTLQNVCKDAADLELNNTRGSHILAMAIFKYLDIAGRLGGSGTSQPGISAIIDKQKGCPVWVMVNLDDKFIDYQGVGKISDISKRIFHGEFGDATNLTIRHGISPHSQVHSPVIQQAEVLSAKIISAMMTPEAFQTFCHIPSETGFTLLANTSQHQPTHSLERNELSIEKASVSPDEKQSLPVPNV